jgi:hypothetical protein
MEVEVALFLWIAAKVLALDNRDTIMISNHAARFQDERLRVAD